MLEERLGKELALGDAIKIPIEFRVGKFGFRASWLYLGRLFEGGFSSKTPYDLGKDIGEHLYNSLHCCPKHAIMAPRRLSILLKENKDYFTSMELDFQPGDITPFPIPTIVRPGNPEEKERFLRGLYRGYKAHKIN